MSGRRKVAEADWLFAPGERVYPYADKEILESRRIVGQLVNQ